MAYQSVLERQKKGGVGGEYVPLIDRIKTGTAPSIPQMPQRQLDLTTSEGLLQMAEQSGLSKQAQQVLATKGEKPKEIFSGGFISDIFDVLNSLQYGVTGMLKGKGFAEGVRTRQSFSDKDALGDHGIPGAIAGIALDIAVDPLTYIAPWTVFKKVGLVPKIIKAVKGAEETKIGSWLGRKFVWMFGADPIFKEAYERTAKNIAIAGSNISNMVKPIAGLTPDIAKKLLKRDETFRFTRTPLKELEGVLNPADLENVKKAYDALDDLGKQAVDLGLLGKGKFEENVGSYIKNAYLEFEQKKGKGIFGFARLGIKGIKQRKLGLTPEEMVKLGQIDNPAYLMFKSMIDLARDVENAKLFRLVGERFVRDIPEEGFTLLGKGARLGELAGKYVPENIAQYINEISTPAKYGIGKQLVANFKFFKVVMNPATHGRNIVSNQVLNWWKLGMNPLDPRTIESNFTALRQMKKGGNWIEEAKTAGYNLNTLASNEILNILNSPEAIGAGKQIGKNWREIQNKLGSIYQGEENFAKLSAFIFNRKHKGMGIEEAWKTAESATFNYAQVTPFIRQLRESLFGFPFITFTFKATPIVVETALKAPRRISVFGKIKQAIENQADIKVTERERAAEPAWIRDGFYIKLPIRDKHGRSAYFDLTYIIPFGDIVSGQYFTRQISGETGVREGLVTTALEKTPALNAIKELSRNQDFFGDRIWNESDSSDKQLGDVMRYLSKQYLPPLVADQLPGGIMKSGERRQKGIVGALKKPEEIRQQRTLMQEMLRNVGIKIQPVDVDIQESFMEWEKKKALNTLLRESGIISEFTRPYVPKR